MTKHTIVNKMAAIRTLLRTADTYSTSATAIDAIRMASVIAFDVGEEAGKGLLPTQKGEMV